MADKATERPYRIGVDVGGTNTDAVLISLNPVSVIASHKALTTPDVTTGITNAIHAVLDASGVSATSVACVIVGTTHFVNAIVQRSSLLRKVAVVRLCGGNEEGFGRNLPPFVDFPEDLSACIDSGSHFFCNGGYQITGEEISPIDTEEIQNVAKTLVEKGVSNIVISGMYAPLNHSQEVVVNGILSEEIQKRGMKPRITMSHEVSGLGYLKRENAAILNATLRPLAEKTVLGFEKAMEEIFGENPCTLFLTQNDGSVLNGSDAISQPIRTFNSGPTNSIRGGELLWRTAMEAEGNVNERRTEPLVVVDIGGTTADSGLLLPSGLPQMSSVMSLVGGVRTNFALPAVESIGVGGGSIVRIKEDNEDVIVGPDSVALNLFARAKLFGGDCLTCSDIVAARSLYSTEVENPFKGLGDLAWLSDITPETIDRVQSVTRRKIEELVDRSKVQKQDVDLLIVGGGAAIVNLDKPLAGVRAARTVNGGEVANAVGAAISRVSGTVDTVVDTSGKSIKEAQEDVCKLARQKALDNGAKEETIEIADISILPIQYVEAKARIIVRAVGELSFVATSAGSRKCDITFDEEEHSGHASETNTERTHPPEPEAVDLQTYRPTVEGKEWVISSTDLDFIAAGCKILGCGGGGDPYQEYLKCKALVRRGPGRLRVISPDSLFDDGLLHGEP
ncbi:hypothetical protein KEM55_003095 [Ascosphaera atra]|nr:hypothetical protein KEM55_003095 [Ascosphaera atra]